MVLTCYERPEGLDEDKTLIENAVAGAVGRTGHYDIVVTTKKVYRGVRSIRKAAGEEAEGIASSDNYDGTDVEAPLLFPASSASVPELPFVRRDVLYHYHRARDEGLPELSRINFHQLIYVTAITNALLLRKYLTDTACEDESYLYEYENRNGRIIRSPQWYWRKVLLQKWVRPRYAEALSGRIIRMPWGKLVAYK